MSQLQTNISDIKAVAKNLARELKIMEFDISHSSALNLASRSLGYKNYQTYKAISKEGNISPITNYVTGSKTFSELAKEVEQDKIKYYPSIDNKFIKFGHSEKYDIFIYSENHEDGLPKPYLLFRLKNSYTERIYYIPRDETFSLFVYPTLKEPYQDYYIQIEDIETKFLYSYFFDKIRHINEKNWGNTDILDDLMQLMIAVKEDRKWLKETIEQHSEEKLNKLWSNKNNNY